MLLQKAVINIYFLFHIPPMTNSPIENYFNQIKAYIKKKRNVNSFEELAKKWIYQ